MCEKKIFDRFEIRKLRISISKRIISSIEKCYNLRLSV